MIVLRIETIIAATCYRIQIHLYDFGGEYGKMGWNCAVVSQMPFAGLPAPRY